MTATEFTDHIAGILEQYRFQEATEDALQRGVAEALREAGLLFNREERLLPNGDRIDFVALNRANTLSAFLAVGIECKIKGSYAALLRQIDRYTRFSEIDGIVVLTTRMQHANLPQTLNGKPVRVVCTLGGVV